MDNILTDIVEKTEEDLYRRKREVSFSELENIEGFEKKRLSFREGITGKSPVAYIAEVKKASPSKGIIRADFNPAEIAQRYEEGGASAISVLTDEPFFMGKKEFLLDISRKVKLPLLRKDFIVDPYQVKEAKAYGADAVLIIVAITDGKQLDELLHAADEFGMDALVECYGQEDFNRLDFKKVDILGVNNRDLKKFEVDVHRGIDILKQAPQGTTLVSESGLSTGYDIALLQQNKIDAALIGEFFMRQENPGKAIRNLTEESEKAFKQLTVND